MGADVASRKKKAKAGAAAATPVPLSEKAESAHGSDPAGKGNGGDENAYIKELQK